MPVISVMLLEQSAIVTHVYAGHISDVVRAECCSYILHKVKGYPDI